MPEWPRGTVAFLFTDLEGSTRLWRDFPAVMPAAYARHDAILREAVARYDGIVYKVVGDAFQVAFSTAPAALAAAVAAQIALHREVWEDIGLPGAPRVRMALHAGAVDPDAEGDYRSPVLNRLGRLIAAGHGGQVLLSSTVYELVVETLPVGASLRYLGEHRLDDLETPSSIHQVLHADLPDQFPPPRTRDRDSHNLPPQLTAFLGREREVAAISALLHQEGVRLVTLIGPGGTGKTRLSLQVACELVDDFPDGVWFVELAPIADPAFVLPAIAQAVGVGDEMGRSLAETLGDALREKRLLLVLDNFEHLLAAAPAVGALLVACPELKVLATSRAPLRLRGEREFPVPPLSLPDPGEPVSAEWLTQYEAVRLFIDRAQAVKADFVVNNANAPAVAEICVRVDGLPLAIELAAARVKLLAPEALLRRLGQRLPLLSAGTRDVPARQQTLRGAIAWSHDLLTPAEQSLFRRLAVFAGGFDFEMAESVANYDGKADVFAELSALVDHSLVRQLDEAGGEPRFTMLETIREYAQEQLAACGDEAVTREAHMRWGRELAGSASTTNNSPSTVWLERLDRELDNIRAALKWALETGPRANAQEFAKALAKFWDVRGMYREGLAWLEQAVQGTEPSPQRMRALRVAGLMALWQGEFVRSRAFAEESLALARALGDDPEIAGAIRLFAIDADLHGDYPRAETLYKEALAIDRQLGDLYNVCVGLNNLGDSRHDAGDDKQAAAYLEEALAVAQSEGFDRWRALILHNLALLIRDQGDSSRAKVLLEEALALGREVGDVTRVAGVLGSLGLVAADLDDPARSAVLLGEALGLVKRTGARSDAPKLFEAMARTALLAGHAVPACRLCAAAHAQRVALGTPLPPPQQDQWQRTVAALREVLPDDGFAAAWEAGAVLTLDAATAEATAISREIGDGQEARAG